MELYPCYMYFEQIIIVYTDKNYRTKRNISMINATSKWKLSHESQINLQKVLRGTIYLHHFKLIALWIYCYKRNKQTFSQLFSIDSKDKAVRDSMPNFQKHRSIIIIWRRKSMAHSPPNETPQLVWHRVYTRILT